VSAAEKHGVLRLSCHSLRERQLRSGWQYWGGWTSALLGISAAGSDAR